MRTSLTVLTPRRPLSSLPFGWYVVAASEALRAGSLLRVRLAGHELVAWRSESGVASVSDGYCPHLGASFASGGCVRGEHLWCPFHGFEFDATGACVKTGYGTKPPPAARLPTLPVVERHGVVHAWFHPEGEAPSFELPTLDEAGWTPVRLAGFDLESHPQETSENSVDIGHLAVTHGYENVELLGTRHEGPYLNTRFRFVRRDGIFGRLSRPITSTANVHVHGLGVSIVEVEVESLGIQTRQFVYSTPTDPGRVKLRIGMSMKIERPSTIHPAFALAPTPLVRRFASAAAFREFVADVRQDFKIWNHKVYIPRPALADGDGPVGIYRRWARQFTQSVESSDAAAE
ncbi:MAG: Rieske 2Fe-2S domain-containing protein [Polyangiales bacterium]